jgi:tRNA(fMet)-specific endonuclease VapC
MLRYLLDTNLCIRVLRDRPQGLRTRFNAEAGSLCISTVVLMELLHGAGKSARSIENRREVERFAARLDLLAFTRRQQRMRQRFVQRWSAPGRSSVLTT